MQIRRVITGRSSDGRSTFVGDGHAPRTHDFVHMPGMSSTLVWATEPDGTIADDGADPTADVSSFVPREDGTRFLIIRFAPDSVAGDPGFDPAAAVAEQMEVSPGLAELFEPDNPGMHTTDTVDYVIVLDGELWLELDDGDARHLTPGDVVIQNGTRHAWRNKTDRPATVAAILIGAGRAR